MPILAELRPDAPAVSTAPQVAETRRLDFASLDGSSGIEWTGDEWIMQSGVSGLGISPRQVVTQEYAGLDGARIAEVRTGPREIVIPFFVASADYQTVGHRLQLARIRSFLDHRAVNVAAAEGTFDLVATAGPSVRLLRCLYVDGMEGSWGVETGNGSYYSTFDLKLIAVSPHWRGGEWSTPVVRVPVASPFLSNSPANAWPRKLSSTIALGADMQVTVGGDVPSPAVVELVGPATSTHITSPQGLDVTVGAVGAGQTLVVDTGRPPGRRQRVTLDGVSAWNLVADPARWAPLPPGEASISVVVTGATSATTARVFGTELWETAW